MTKSALLNNATYLKSGIPLGVLIPAPAMTMMFLHLSPLIRLTMSSTEWTAEELNLRTWLNFAFLGDMLLDREGGWGFGVSDSFLNDEVNLVSDWLVPVVPGFFFVARLRGLMLRRDPLVDVLQTDDFKGDANGKRWVFVDCMKAVDMKNK